MTKSSYQGPIPDAYAVEHALLRHNEGFQTPALNSVIAGSVAAAITSLSPTHQEAICAIQHQLADLVSEFVRTLVAEAVRRQKEYAIDASTQAASGVDAYGLDTRPVGGWAHPLDTMQIEEWAGRVAGQTYLEKNLSIPRSTLHMWQRRNEVVALRKGCRKHVFPLAQFVDGRPVPGLRDVLSVIANPRAAWLWLKTPSPDLNGRVPIEMLRLERVSEVVSAANFHWNRNHPISSNDGSPEAGMLPSVPNNRITSAPCDTARCADKISH